MDGSDESRSLVDFSMPFNFFFNAHGFKMKVLQEYYAKLAAQQNTQGGDNEDDDDDDDALDFIEVSAPSLRKRELDLEVPER